MMYPQNNSFRQYIDLSGIWDFAFEGNNPDREDGFSDGEPVAVPGSWNDQIVDGRDNLGPAWYQMKFHQPWGFADKTITLRFGSVNYLADVWLNGEYLGQHESGHLPFSFDVTGRLQYQGNLLVVRVDGELAFDRVPPGNVTGSDEAFFSSHAGNYPQAQFDVFPYCGIHRPVLLSATPTHGIQDITVTTSLDGATGIIDVEAQSGNGTLKALLSGFDKEYSADFEAGRTRIAVPNANLWHPDTPHLYQLTVEQWDGERQNDSYALEVGIRELTVDGSQLLVNGKPVYLTGFGRHEDFSISGRGLNRPVNIRDFSLLKWLGANSFRTSHYPYSEETMQLADKLGFLVIDEIPAVGLYFAEDGYEKRLALCQQQLSELIDRDKNHPSVIIWSIANEPHSEHPDAIPYLQKLAEQARTLDSTRPVTLVSFLGLPEESFSFLDVVCLNRYLGWYTQTGRIELGAEMLSKQLDEIFEKFNKPIMLTEFGADAIAGFHAHPPEMFSEEYQDELINRYIDVLRSKPYVVGEHVWNMCDFKTSQGITRASGLNHKGVFTRDRRPKMAAFSLRARWAATTQEQ